MKTAQTTLETCVFITVLALATLAMTGYLRRAIQFNMKTNADNFSSEQYDGDNSCGSGADTVFSGSTATYITSDGSSLSKDLSSTTGEVLKWDKIGTYNK